jgi:hypothetical protein
MARVGPPSRAPRTVPFWTALFKLTHQALFERGTPNQYEESRVQDRQRYLRDANLALHGREGEPSCLQS